MTQSVFITIEGIEGAGKSTALKFIHDYLTQAGCSVYMTREPGGTELAEEIRKVLLHPASAETMRPEAELLLMFAARAQHIKEAILPALNKGQWVVSDRFLDASYAYQGGGRGIEMDFIAELDRRIVGNLYPDLTLLLDVPPDVGFSRAEKRGTQKDRIEQEKIDFFVRVRNSYLERAARDRKRIRVIDASQSLTSVQSEIQKGLDELIARKKA